MGGNDSRTERQLVRCVRLLQARGKRDRPEAGHAVDDAAFGVGRHTRARADPTNSEGCASARPKFLKHVWRWKSGTCRSPSLRGKAAIKDRVSSLGGNASPLFDDRRSRTAGGSTAVPFWLERLISIQAFL